VKRFVRKGVPSEHRPLVSMFVCVSRILYSAHTTLIRSLSLSKFKKTSV